MLLNWLLFSTLSVCVSSSKILFISMPDGKSHFGSMMPLIRRLEKDGHEISVYFEISQPFKLAPTLKNYLLTVKGAKKPAHTDPAHIYWIWNSDITPFGSSKRILASARLNEKVMKHQPEDFWRVANQTWDLIFVDSFFTFGGVYLAQTNPAPNALFHTSFMETITAPYRGLGWSSAIHVPSYLSFEKLDWYASDFWDRLFAFQHDLSFDLVFHTVVRLMEGWQLKDSWNSYMEKSVASFSDQIDAIDWPMPMSGQLILTGAYCPDTSHIEPLNPGLEDFISDPDSKGTILVAFGTMVDWGTAPKHKMEAMFGALKRLKDYRVIWQFKDAKIDMPKHIVTMGWLPQAALLAHKSMKLFVSHGGLKSMKETICAQVPAVYVPLFAEQVRNAFFAKYVGYGRYVNKKNMTADYVFHEINQILENRSYYANVKRAKGIWQDKVVDSLDLGVFWVNQIVKRKGLPQKFFRPKALSCIQAYSLDIFVLISSLVFVSRI